MSELSEQNAALVTRELGPVWANLLGANERLNRLLDAARAEGETILEPLLATARKDYWSEHSRAARYQWDAYSLRALGELREAGWVVAVHNDYRLNGKPHTFWLFTHEDGRWIKGEGDRDGVALEACAAQAGLECRFHNTAPTARAEGPQPSYDGSKSLELRPEVRAFAELMEAALRANDHKPGWKGDHPLDLMTRMRQEAGELGVEVVAGSRTSLEAWRARVGAEAADVANFAMMVADVCGALNFTARLSDKGGDR